jgi:hypothetical protein
MICDYNNRVSFDNTDICTVILLSGFNSLIHFTSLKSHIFISVLIHEDKGFTLHFLLSIYPIDSRIPAKEKYIS